ncbi:binding-protein-dependent transport systems inner membrane component [Thermaerobacter marianensis DSM 12885]|uniref:Binding-protein-dependent transport systems inner membrane component n=1 Tax=Thermaerobacter marianensis (strain ATCC 700841 / DSM 12885 / JCM 10246 / 7p75a) TaxID=644966 RepID=E6SM90_THEM7|nr:ABC transporter permease [Thermaerobacter marianensis]ADU51449.1 binding-protein-dependent transport systems inner membrane component [Thermaerobacter marianensis DSM 12885]
MSVAQGQAAAPAAVPTARERRWYHSFFRPMPVLGAFLVAVAVAAALGAPYLAPFDPEVGELGNRLLPPAWAADQPSPFLLGTDTVGRDLLSRIIYGARISLLVGICSVGLSVVVGVLLGLVAGYAGGRLDDLLMRFVDLQLSFPFILLAITVMAVLGPGLWKVIVLMAIAQWGQYARVVRGEVMVVKQMGFVEAARCIGTPPWMILRRHILPNVMNSVIVLATLNIANNILLEAGLTFLGLGVDPSTPSWGGMLASARDYVTTAWWFATFPGLAIMFTVLGFNLLGDWLRDVLDPKLDA